MHDYLTQRGGAERVVLAMARAFPNAPIYTSVYCPDTTFPEFRERDVRPLWTDALQPLRADHRRGLLVYPVAFTAARIDAAVTLCSSSGFAHAVRTTGRKIVYCHTPARWLYDEATSYLQGWPAPIRLALRGAAPALRAWDQGRMADAQHVLANSTAVAERIRTSYGMEAEVLPAPVGVTLGGAQRAVAGIRPGYLLSVGRLLSYKHVDLLVEAIARVPGARLVVVGDGPERAGLESGADERVTFTGQVDDAELRWLYANCAGVASASYEDYGLTPLEAAVHGKPAAALRFGGFLDTVIDGETGVFFDAPRVDAVVAALAHLLSHPWDAERIRAHAAAFGEDTFHARLRTVVIRHAFADGPARSRRLRSSLRRGVPVTTRHRRYGAGTVRS